MLLVRDITKFCQFISQIAFHPKFSLSRVEKERRAILSELQMMNTIEYRVDCQVSKIFMLSSVLLFETSSEKGCNL